VPGRESPELLVLEVAMDSDGPGAISGALERLTYGRGRNGQQRTRPQRKAPDPDGWPESDDVASSELEESGRQEEQAFQIDIRV